MSYTKSYKLQKVDIVFDDGEKADIIDMVGEFNWMESIDYLLLGVILLF